MFQLSYICANCGYSVGTLTTDGKVHNPPDFCIKCSVIDEGLSIKRKKKEPGDIINGLLLEVFSRIEKSWRVQCLFCLERTLVKYNNVGIQKSCGCLKKSPLTPTFFNPIAAEVECDCEKCGLRSTYKLDSGVPILCRSGCI